MSQKHEESLHKFGISIDEKGFVSDNPSIRAGELFAAMDDFAGKTSTPNKYWHIKENCFRDSKSVLDFINELNKNGVLPTEIIVMGNPVYFISQVKIFYYSKEEIY